MLKKPISLSSDLEAKATDHLRTALAGIPFLSLGELAANPRVGTYTPDITLPVQARDQSWTLVCEVKSSGQPRFVREAAFQLRKTLQTLGRGHSYGILIAPHLSADSIALLQEESLGYLDFAGNCRLSFDGVFIERSGTPRGQVERRELRELFSPKAARVLRVLFTEPDRAWRVIELANHARVSLGQVSNVRRALLDREWARKDEQGLRLRNPGSILDAWRPAYKPPVLEQKEYHTLLHGDGLAQALGKAFAAAVPSQHLLLSSFSAAQWLAPFARVAGTFLYADTIGDHALQKALQLQPAALGANVTLYIPKDDSAFIGSFSTPSGLHCTSALQTYLDLSVAGERGREAADHLRNLLLEPQWSRNP